jgi:hypothetical protein
MFRVSVSILVVVSIHSLARAADAPATQPAATPARIAYARFQSLAGEWEGKSTKGWTERLVIRPIAKGSCVMETSTFAHGDGDAMVTMYHLDGDALMLTHYCMAQNQPRLRATEISPDGRELTFTFIDGTNLPSRDVGHMDKVKIHFDSDDAYRSQWTFYAKGKEQWMEEITYKRTAGPTTPETR